MKADLEKELRQAQRRAVWPDLGGSGRVDGSTNVATMTVSTRDAVITRIHMKPPYNTAGERVFVGYGTAKRMSGEPYDYDTGVRLSMGRACLELGMRLINDAASRVPDDPRDYYPTIEEFLKYGDDAFRDGEVWVGEDRVGFFKINTPPLKSGESFEVTLTPDVPVKMSESIDPLDYYTPAEEDPQRLTNVRSVEKPNSAPPTSRGTSRGFRLRNLLRRLVF